MKKFDQIKNTVTSTISRTGMVVRKNSPEIYMAVGVVTLIGAVAWTIAKSVRSTEITIDAGEDLRDIERQERAAEEVEVCPEQTTEIEVMSPSEARVARCMVVKHAAIEYAKIYWPTIVLTGTSILCFLAANRILKKRYLGAVAAYNAASAAFLTYRNRVREELGEEKDFQFLTGATPESQIMESVVDGKKKREKVTENVVTEESLAGNPYVRIFNYTNPNWDSNALFNMKWLQAKNEEAIHLLNAQGHLFLNEVLDLLGYPRTPEGAVTGWVLDGEGDGFVDFGIFSQNSAKFRDMRGNDSDAIVLSFNVDGVIWDKIGNKSIGLR